jgi:hypothetical protein
MTVPFPGLTIKYTTDGSTPTAASPGYDPSNPPAVSACNTLVGAQAFADGATAVGVPNFSRWLQEACA